MPRAPRARDAAAETAPRWLRDAAARVWRRADWERWETRVRPALETRGVTVEMLEPVYGAAGSNLVGIAARPPGVGWCVGWIAGGRSGRTALFRAASELLRALDAAGDGPPPARRGARAYGDWLGRRAAPRPVQPRPERDEQATGTA